MTGEPLDSLGQFPDEDDWIIVPRWAEFQHYKHRNPPWIRVYSRLLLDDDYANLSLASKGLLQVIWLAYAQHDGCLRVGRCRRYVRPMILGWPQLSALNHAGFIEFSASKPLAHSDTRDRVHKEKEEPVENPTGKRPKGGGSDTNRDLLHRAVDLAADWEGGTSEKFSDALDNLERELHAQLPVSVRERLWYEALKREQP